jgi:hypothetical protein
MCNILAVCVRILENKSWPKGQLTSHGFSQLPHANSGMLHVSYQEIAVPFHSTVTSLFIIHHPTIRSNLNLQGYDSIVKRKKCYRKGLQLIMSILSIVTKRSETDFFKVILPTCWRPVRCCLFSEKRAHKNV